MNAKELRQAAEYTVTMWDNHDSKRIVAGDELFFNSNGEPDSVTFARHILATVREDDDERVSEEKAQEIVGKMAKVHIGEDYINLVTFDDIGDVDQSVTCRASTMSQFRSLCRGLGIELKEVDCVD